MQQYSINNKKLHKEHNKEIRKCQSLYLIILYICYCTLQLPDFLRFYYFIFILVFVTKA